MRSLDCEIVDGISEKILTFSARSRFGVNNELAFTTMLIREIPRHQARFVVTEVHRITVTVFSFVNNLVVHILMAILKKLLRSLDVTEIGLRQDIGNSDQYLCKPNQEFL